MNDQSSDAVRNETTQVVFGADVVMTRRGREVTLHTPDASGRRVLGRYASTAAAWEALDNLDAPAVDVSRAA